MKTDYGWETEAAWKSKVTQAARLCGWLTYHTYDSRRSDEGFPDLVLVRERVIFAELKTNAKQSKLSNMQVVWKQSLEDAGAEIYVWRPADWDEITKLLAKRKRS